MKITFYIHNKGKREFLWEWRDAQYVPRKDELISFKSLGYGEAGVNKVALVQSVLWIDKNNVEITLGI